MPSSIRTGKRDDRNITFIGGIVFINRMLACICLSANSRGSICGCKITGVHSKKCC